MEKDTEIIEEVGKTPLKKVPFAGLLVAVMGLLLLVVTRSPGSGGPMLILLFLLLAFVGTLCFSAIALNITTRILGGSSISRIRLLYTSVAIASGLVFLVGLQTLRQLQVIDLVLVVAFEVLLNFYLLRRF